MVDTTRSTTSAPLDDRWPDAHANLCPAELVEQALRQGNARLAVIDLDTRQVTSMESVGRTPDVLLYEPEHRMVYVAAEDGTVSLFTEDFLERGLLRLVTSPNAGPNAHSIGLDTTTRHLYVPTANILGAPVLREFSLEGLPEPDD